MADEQPALLARGLRDVTKVPLAEELVKNNVGSTVKNQEQQFAIVSQAASAAASAHYLDPSLQARVQSPPSSLKATMGTGNGATATNISSGRDGVNANGALALGEEAGGPVVIMSDADNYRPDPTRRKGRKTCCIQ